jgi:hypothetical protein
VSLAGKLPLLELEAEGVEALRKSKADCLTIFLQPPDLEVHEGRLRTYLTETEAEIAERTEQAAAERAAAIAAGVYDAEIVNDNHDEAYKQLCAAISKFRPDIIPPAEEVEAAEAAAAAAAAGGSMPHLVLCGPPGENRGLAGDGSVAASLGDAWHQVGVWVGWGCHSSAHPTTDGRKVTRKEGCCT